ADPVHHDDGGRDGRCPGDLRRAARGTRGGQSAGDTRSLMDRVLAPLGRRPTTVVARETYGAYVVLRTADVDGPHPDPGQFYMLSAGERWGGGDGERPFLPRAFSVLRAPAGGHELQFLLEDVGPGT